jgi:hypothetical protein
MKTAVFVTKLLALGTSLSAMALYRFIHLGTACSAIMKIALVTANDVTPLTSLFVFVWLFSYRQVPVNETNKINLKHIKSIKRIKKIIITDHIRV